MIGFGLINDFAIAIVCDDLANNESVSDQWVTDWSVIVVLVIINSNVVTLDIAIYGKVITSGPLRTLHSGPEDNGFI